MVEPSWLAGTLAVAMLAVVAYSVGRLAARYAWHLRIERDVEIAHGAMGLSMAGMLERNLTLIPGSAWVAIFVASALWFAARSVGFRAPFGAAGGPGHDVPLVVASGAMVYMIWAMPTWSGMAALICGARMVGMTERGTQCGQVAWTGTWAGRFPLRKRGGLGTPPLPPKSVDDAHSPRRQ